MLQARALAELAAAESALTGAESELAVENLAVIPSMYLPLALGPALVS